MVVKASETPTFRLSTADVADTNTTTKADDNARELQRLLVACPDDSGVDEEDIVRGSADVCG